MMGMTRVPRDLPRRAVPRRHGALRLLLILALTATAAPAVASAPPCATTGVPGAPYEGFGAATTGGLGRPVYRVTTLNDDGPGSLRDAVSRGNRCVVFEVSGDIRLRAQVYVKGPSVTVDGFTAPAPGVTLRDFGISVWGTNGAHDVILRGLRIRDAGQRTCPPGGARGRCYDGIQVKNGAHAVVIDHVSVDNATDGAIDISDSSDVTVQWSVFSGTKNQALINRALRVSMHHNLFIGGQSRNPQAQWDVKRASEPPATILDLRNNVLWDYSAYGTIVRPWTTANLVGNYYYSASRPSAKQAVVQQGRVHAAGNHSGNGADVDAAGTETQAFAAASVTTTDACRAAYEVLRQAGAHGPRFTLDAVDRTRLASMPSDQLPGCGPSGNPEAALSPRPVKAPVD